MTGQIVHPLECRDAMKPAALPPYLRATLSERAISNVFDKTDHGGVVPAAVIHKIIDYGYS